MFDDHEDISDVPEPVYFFAAELVSKWGFKDGDLLNWLRRLGYDDPRAVLCAVVRQELLPALRQKVEVQELQTIHNPIRATTVDGEDVTWMHTEADLMADRLFTPDCVALTRERIVEIARSLADERGAKRITTQGTESTAS